MNDQDSINHEALKKLLEENNRLLQDNNKLLHDMRRRELWGIFFKVIWFILIFIAPLYIYLNFIEPQMGALTDQIQFFQSLKF